MSDDLESDAERLLSLMNGPEFDLEDGTKTMECWIVATLTEAMTKAAKTTEQISAANAAIKYLAVKSKLPVKWGEGFDE